MANETTQVSAEVSVGATKTQEELSDEAWLERVLVEEYTFEELCPTAKRLEKMWEEYVVGQWYRYYPIKSGRCRFTIDGTKVVYHGANYCKYQLDFRKYIDPDKKYTGHYFFDNAIYPLFDELIEQVDWNDWSITLP